MSPLNCKVVSELSEHQVTQLHDLYRQQWWSKDRTLDATKSGVQGSQIVVGLLDEDDSLIGFARVLTDYTFKALIFDVIVSEPFRRMGLGSRLISIVTAHEALREVRHFELYCLPEMEKLYEAHGFSTEVGAVQLMRRSRVSA